MANIFERMCDGQDMTGVALSDYEPYQLAGYMLRHYPGDPIGALGIYRNNLEIGLVLYSITLTLLEGFKGDKRDEMLRSISKQVGY